MKITTIMLIIIIITSLAFSIAFAEPKIYVTKIIEGEPPIIDGLADDAVWNEVEWAGNFIQREPNQGEAPSQQTIFKILYDQENIYAIIRAYDTELEKISKRMSRRDGFAGDWVEINIDSYYDHRTAFSFTASVSGVKGDEFISEDGDNWDANWDPIWFFKTYIDKEGWLAEIKIPLSQLRFGNKENHIWGLQVSRRLFRKNELSNWNLIPIDADGWVRFFGELRGLNGLKPKRQIDIIPYTVGKAEYFEKEEGNPFATGQSGELQFGLDSKIGVTNDLILDCTINPDFGQVEADPSEVNLTEFETFFTEKRPFFIEGNNIFSYRVSPSVWSTPSSYDIVFYSRRIGRRPHLFFFSDPDRDFYADSIDSTTILGALKLTGKTKNGLSIGILESVTAEEKIELYDHGEKSKAVVEPLTNYFVTRIQKDFREGRTLFGGIITATNRDLKDTDLEFLHRAAYSGGFDFFHRFFENNYYYYTKTVMSSVRGDKEAISETQLSPTHYFQRPDAEHLDFNDSRTSLNGHGGTVKGGKSGGGHWMFESGFSWRSPELELNDIGYMRSADNMTSWTWLGYRFRKPFSIFNNFAVNMNEASEWDFSGENTSNLLNANSNCQFINNWNISTGLTYAFQSISNSELRGGPSLKLPGYWSHDFHYESDYSKNFAFMFETSNIWGNEGNSREQNYGFEVTYTPMDTLSLSVNPSITLRLNELEYVTTAENEKGEERYVFAEIDQTTFSMTVRISYNITPDLTIQYYGQPFISAGQYSEFKRITDPRAADYTDRFDSFTDDQIQIHRNGYLFVDEDGNGFYDYHFDNPDFNVQYFISNLVIRWEYIAGSTIYLVWSQNREGIKSIGTFRFNEDLKDLYGIYPHNIFLLKANYWFQL